MFDLLFCYYAYLHNLLVISVVDSYRILQEHSTAIMTNGQGQNGSAVKRIKVSTSTNSMSLSFFQGTVLGNGTEAENEEEEGWQRPVSFVPLRSSCSLLQHLADTSSPAHLERW